jgi:anhydro-N-acetylmuramic acid kinase
MVYRVIGVMSGSSMDGLDMAYCVFSEIGGEWSCEIEAADSIQFNEDWKQKLPKLTELSAMDLLQTHVDFGHYVGQQINTFIEKNALEHKVHFVASHGHTVFHNPTPGRGKPHGMTFQMGDGASIAAELELPVISDLRNMDIAFGGQGAPIVPIAEKLLWGGYEYFLNLGGIANIAHHVDDKIAAFDVCPANRVLNALLNTIGKEYDDKGTLAASGTCDGVLLEKLNALVYYHQEAPKSLANQFGLEQVLPLIQQSKLELKNQANTFVEHVAMQIGRACTAEGKMLISGGGAHNDYLLRRISYYAGLKNITIEKADVQTIEYKEAVAMALMGALRWREEENVLSSVTGSRQNSIGGALWMGRN